MSGGPPTRAGGKPVLLVVEDDRSLREGLAMNLRMEGYEVLTAADGEEGMRLAFDARPDLIVLDIMMPGWSPGWTFSRSSASAATRCRC